MSAVRRTAAVLVAAIALALALGHLGPGVNTLPVADDGARIDAVSRIHDAVPAVRLRALDSRVNHLRPALAAAALTTMAALAVLAFSAAEVLPHVPARNVLRRPAAGRGPPR